MDKHEFLAFMLGQHLRSRNQNDLFGPTAFLAAHHRLQYALCALLVDMGLDPHRPNGEEDAAAALKFLRFSLPLHEIDEEEDLRCAVEAAARDDPDIARLFDLVVTGHAIDKRLAEPVCEGLGLMARGHKAFWSRDFTSAFLKLSRSLRRHLDWEEAVILPLAEEYLSQQVQASLLTCMAQRRGESSRMPFAYRRSYRNQESFF